MSRLTLEEVLEDAWWLLRAGQADPAHGFHWPVLATVSPHGGPDARTVVLREVEPAQQRLTVHSAADAGKCAQLRACPSTCLVFHHAPAKTQLRVWGESSIHVGDAVATDAWGRLAPHSRALYPDFADFAVLRIQVSRLDWLLLDPAGHQRAGFDLDDLSARGLWLKP